MNIEIIKRTTTYLERKDGEERKEPEVEETILNSFELDSELATALLWLLNGETNYSEISKDGNLEISKSSNSWDGQQEKELVIKFIK
jgi:hypothetical protein